MTGEVIIDGKAVNAGTVNVVPAQGTQGPRVSARIQSGRFTILGEQELQPGQHRVTVLTDADINDMWGRTEANEVSAPEKSTRLTPRMQQVSLVDGENELLLSFDE
ncbi:MAG: hypothetical protein KDB05_18060 [Planctomycetales bacterium]|nr:hypothetical protein [Planctomycetales bacterium]